MYHSSGNYEAFSRPRKPEGVEKKTAWFVGSGLAALAGAALLIRDGQMPGKRITILEQQALPGGALDGIKDPEKGFVIRGGREMEDQRINEVFGKKFLSSNFWLYWRTMFAYEEWHSALEMKLYLHRFIHQTPANLNLGPAPAWNFWRRIAAKDPAFGHPDVFGTHIPETKWESTTVTTLDPRIPKYIQKIAKRDPFSGKVVTDSIVTAKDSSWLLSWTVNRQPHFKQQPKDQIVVWVYALFVEKPGDYVKKYSIPPTTSGRCCPRPAACGTARRSTFRGLTSCAIC